MVSKTIKIILIVAVIVLVLAVVGVLVWLFAFKEDEEADEVIEVVRACEIYPFVQELHPLIILTGTSSFLYPTWPEKVLRFSENQAVDFICPGRTLWLGSSNTSSSLLSGTCLNGTIFLIGDVQYDWEEMRCSNYHWRTIRDTGNGACNGNGRELEAGFDVEDGRFLRTLLICFNTALQIAYYTYIEQTASINQQVLDTPRPSWLQGSAIYNIGTVTNLYVRNTQRATINSLLGLPSDSRKYIEDSSDYYLARGHMTARSDNYYAAAKNATFYMQNIAPQWQTFNGYNWNQIEMDLREYASEKGLDLQVWTGVHGVTTLPHEETGEPVELYLYVTNTTKALPVPAIYWKVAYDPLSERGVALIGVNNPYDSTLSTLCFDISERITWLHCHRTSQHYGFCYACTITQLRYEVTSIPNIADRGLLL